VIDDEYDNLVRQAAAELDIMKKEHGYVNLALDPGLLLTVIGALQLATRHEGFKSLDSYQMIIAVIDGLEDYLKDYPAITALIRRGNNPEFDLDL
jgi:hypothetical protein